MLVAGTGYPGATWPSEFLRPLLTRHAVLTFDQSAKLTLPFTTDAAQARAAFKLDAQPNQHTAIFDAALAAARAFDARPSDARERHIAAWPSGWRSTGLSGSERSSWPPQDPASSGTTGP